MFLSILKAEQIKLCHGNLWIAFFILPIIPTLFGTANYLGNIEILENLWESLWTQQTLFSCYFFIPMLAGIYCAYLWRLEHMGSNWNQVLVAPVSRSALVFAKLLLAFDVSAAMVVWILVLFLISGLLIGLPLSALPKSLPLWLAGGFMGTAALCAVQLFLGLVFRSFAVPVGISLLGGICGLIMVAKGMGYFFPYSLLAMGFHTAVGDGSAAFGSLVVSCVIFLLVFTATSVVWMKKGIAK